MSLGDRPFLAYQPIQQIAEQGFVPSGKSEHNWVKKIGDKEVHVHVDHFSMTGFMVRFSTLDKTGMKQVGCLTGISPFEQSAVLEEWLNK